MLTLLEASFHTGSIGLTGNISGSLHPIDPLPLALGIPHSLAYTANHIMSLTLNKYVPQMHALMAYRCVHSSSMDQSFF